MLPGEENKEKDAVMPLYARVCHFSLLTAPRIPDWFDHVNLLRLRYFFPSLTVFLTDFMPLGSPVGRGFSNLLTADVKFGCGLLLIPLTCDTSRHVQNVAKTDHLLRCNLRWRGKT